MSCSHLSLSLLVVAGSRSHLLEISTHMNSIDVYRVGRCNKMEVVGKGEIV